MPGHPDAEALRCALLDRAGDRSASGAQPLSAPPMLRGSYQALVARDAVEPELLVDGSLAEQAATRQRPDGVWLRWDTPTDEFDVVEVDSAVMAQVASAIGNVVDLGEELIPEAGAAPTPPSGDVSFGSTGWFDRFRERFERNLGVARAPRGPFVARGPRTSPHMLGGGETAGIDPPEYGDGLDPDPEPELELDLDLTTEPVPRDVADLAAMISRIAAHGTDSGPVSLGDLSRQLGLPVTTVRRGLEEIARSSGGKPRHRRPSIGDAPRGHPRG